MRPGSRTTLCMAIASVALLAAALAYEPGRAGAEDSETAKVVIGEQTHPAASHCPASTWPYVDADCIANNENDAPAAIRIITLDRPE